MPQFIQINPHSFHGHFSRPGESPSSKFPRFHPCKHEDIDTSLQWRVALEDDIQVEYVGEASRREYINQKKEYQAELEAMGRW